MALVIKYGGSLMRDDMQRAVLAAQIRELARAGKRPVVVHGGGPAIARALAEAGLESHFVRGLRVTTERSLPIIEQTLTVLGKRLAQEIGGAVGLTARDDHLLSAELRDPELGLVGSVKKVNDGLIKALLDSGITPVIACLAENIEGYNLLNVNGDDAASAVAAALRAPLVFVTDVPGVFEDPADPSTRCQQLRAADVKARIEDGRISGGMIPKVEGALAALERGASFTIITGAKTGLEQALEGRAGTRITL